MSKANKRTRANGGNRDRNKETILHLEVETLANGGDGVARDAQGRAVFVQGGLPGEQVAVKLTQNKKKFARGVVKDIKVASDIRVEEPCGYAKLCGGCTLQHVLFEEQARLKTDAVLESMRRISGLDTLELSALQTAPGMEEWRVRATVRARRIGNDLKVGFLQRGSHRLVPVHRCMALVKPLQVAMSKLQEVLSLFKAHEGVFFLELAGSAGDVVVTVEEIVGVKHVDRCFQQLVEMEGSPVVCVGWKAHALKGVDDAQQGMVGRYSVDAGVALTRCPQAVRDEQVPAAMFRQAHTDMGDVLIERALEMVRGVLQTQDGESRIVEFFAGCGNFTFPLVALDGVSSVSAFEGAGDAVRVGRRLAEALELDGVEFHVADLFEEKGLAKVSSKVELNAQDIVFLDPPRAGAKELCEWFVQQDVYEHIVYVACDPGTLARDMKVLSEGGWRVERLEMVDMFPGTAHIESVCVLKRA